MEKHLRKWMERQTKRDYNNVHVTVSVDDASKKKHKAAKPNYRRPDRRSQDHDKELIKEIVREVVSEVMAQMGNQQSCNTCPSRSNHTGSKKQHNGPRNYTHEWKPNGSIEYRNR